MATVAAGDTPLHVYPDGASPVLRAAAEGDLVRVMGVAGGVNGDTSFWWATTTGFTPIASLAKATGAWAQGWNPPGTEEAPGGWWADVPAQAAVYAAGATFAPVVGTLAAGERVKVLREEEGEPVNGNAIWLRIDGGRYAGS